MTLLSPFTAVHFWEVHQKLSNRFLFEFAGGRFLWRHNQKLTVPTLLIINILNHEPEESWDLLWQFVQEMQYDMTSKEHKQLASALLGESYAQLDLEKYNIYAENEAVLTKGSKKFRIPDLTISQEPEERTEKGALKNPVVIAEILSPSNREIDETEKLEEYKEIESLQEYLIFEQNQIGVKQYSRRTEWEEKQFSKPEEIVELPSVGVKWHLEKIYRKLKA